MNSLLSIQSHGNGAGPAERPRSSTIKLYRVGDIVGAAFFGGIAASTYFLGENLKRIGEETTGRRLQKFGILTQALIVGVLIVNPHNIRAHLSFVPISFVYLAMISPPLTSERREAFKAHFAQGGRKESIWKVLAIVILFLSGVFASAFLMGGIAAVMRHS